MAQGARGRGAGAGGGAGRGEGAPEGGAGRALEAKGATDGQLAAALAERAQLLARARGPPPRAESCQLLCLLMVCLCSITGGALKLASPHVSGHARHAVRMSGGPACSTLGLQFCTSPGQPCNAASGQPWGSMAGPPQLQASDLSIALSGTNQLLLHVAVRLPLPGADFPVCRQRLRRRAARRRWRRRRRPAGRRRRCGRPPERDAAAHEALLQDAAAKAARLARLEGERLHRPCLHPSF